jgi:hypothetical protein
MSDQITYDVNIERMSDSTSEIPSFLRGSPFGDIRTTFQYRLAHLRDITRAISGVRNGVESDCDDLSEVKPETRNLDISQWFIDLSPRYLSFLAKQLHFHMIQSWTL